MSRHDYDPGCDCHSCQDDRKHRRLPGTHVCVKCLEDWPCDVAKHVAARTAEMESADEPA